MNLPWLCLSKELNHSFFASLLKPARSLAFRRSIYDKCIFGSHLHMTKKKYDQRSIVGKGRLNMEHVINGAKRLPWSKRTKVLLRRGKQKSNSPEASLEPLHRHQTMPHLSPSNHCIRDYHRKKKNSLNPRR